MCAPTFVEVVYLSLDVTRKILNTGLYEYSAESAANMNANYYLLLPDTVSFN